MAEGLSAAAAAGVLNALCNGTPWSVPPLHIQLHVGPPGPAGTANQAIDTRRAAAGFAIASGPSVVNDAAVTWANLSGAQDPTHFSAWDSASGGTFNFSGVLNSAPYAAGNTLTIPAGGLMVSLQVAS